MATAVFKNRILCSLRIRISEVIHGQMARVIDFPELRPSRPAIRQNRNRPLSALIRNLENASQLAWKSFGNWRRFPVIFPFHQITDRALNSKTRTISMPDGKSSLEKGRGGLAQNILGR